MALLGWITLWSVIWFACYIGLVGSFAKTPIVDRIFNGDGWVYYIGIAAGGPIMWTVLGVVKLLDWVEKRAR